MPLDVDFSAAPGEVTALVGPSGSGKTSTLRAIAGFMRPADGAVVCGGGYQSAARSRFCFWRR